MNTKSAIDALWSEQCSPGHSIDTEHEVWFRIGAASALAASRALPVPDPQLAAPGGEPEHSTGSTDKGSPRATVPQAAATELALTRRDALNLLIDRTPYGSDVAASTSCAVTAIVDAGAVGPAEAENRQLRRMLCAAVCGATAYTDDGEASDASVHPFIDFLRDTPANIEHCLRERNRARVGAVGTLPAPGEMPAAEAGAPPEAVMWQVRWLNPAGTANPPSAMMEWSEVRPWMLTQTLEQRIQELRDFRYDGKPAYEVRALCVMPGEQA